VHSFKNDEKSNVLKLWLSKLTRINIGTKNNVAKFLKDELKGNQIFKMLKMLMTFKNSCSMYIVSNFIFFTLKNN
jgi:hypothetical protein